MLCCMEPTPEAVAKRLVGKIEVTDSGCWLSLYSVGSHGYSQIGWQCRQPDECGVKVHMALGHRLSWEYHRGPIPTGMTIDHICKVRRCINPEHLRLLPNKENATDNGRSGQMVPPVPIGKKCRRGTHELLRYSSGAVACRECSNDRHRKKDLRDTACPVCKKEYTSRSRWRDHLRRVHLLRPADF